MHPTYQLAACCCGGTDPCGWPRVSGEDDPRAVDCKGNKFSVTRISGTLIPQTRLDDEYTYIGIPPDSWTQQIENASFVVEPDDYFESCVPFAAGVYAHARSYESYKVEADGGAIISGGPVTFDTLTTTGLPYMSDVPGLNGLEAVDLSGTRIGVTYGRVSGTFGHVGNPNVLLYRRGASRIEEYEGGSLPRRGPFASIALNDGYGTRPFLNTWTYASGPLAPAEDDANRLEQVEPNAEMVDAVVERVPFEPENPGCQACPRAVRVRGKVAWQDFAGVRHEVDLDEVFLRRCDQYDHPRGMTHSRCIYYARGDQTYTDGTGVILRRSTTLTRVGPLMWALTTRPVTGYGESSMTVVLLFKGDGCPTTISEGILLANLDPLLGSIKDEFPAYPFRDVIPLYDVSAVAVDVPDEPGLCECGDCEDCAGDPEALAVTLPDCPDAPAIPITKRRTYLCKYDGTTFAPPADCAAAFKLIGNNSHIFYRVDSWTPAPPPEGHDPEYDGPWEWTPPSGLTLGTSYRLDYQTGPTRYSGEGRPDRQWFNDNVTCVTGSSPPTVRISFNASGVTYEIGNPFDPLNPPMPWGDLIGTHTIAGNDGSAMTITFIGNDAPGVEYEAKSEILPNPGETGGPYIYEVTYVNVTDGWSIRAIRPCEDGPVGTYAVFEVTGDPPCVPDTIEVAA